VVRQQLGRIKTIDSLFIVYLYSLISDLINLKQNGETIMRRSASEIISNLEMRIARLERSATTKIKPKRSRKASTRKVAGHLVLAGRVNVRQLQRVIENTPGVEDVEIEDGVLTFLMDEFDNSDVEKEIRDLAKKFKVKFEKGEFTDGLGMVYTKQAKRRNRRASRPMFTIVLNEETTTWVDEEDPNGYELETEELSSEEIDSFEDLLDYMKYLAHDYSWGEWSSSRPEVDVRRSDWITSYEEQDYIQRQTGDSTRASLHFNPSFGVSLDKGQIRQIEKALRM
jgi:hypothetical protein